MFGCSAGEKDKNTSFSLKKLESEFSYGEVFKVNKKEVENIIMRVSDDSLLFGVQDRASRDFSFYWTGLDQKMQKTKKLTISEKIGDKADELYLGVEGYEELGIRNDEKFETVGILNFSGRYFDLYKNNLVDNYSDTAELENEKQLTYFRDTNDSVESRVLITWDRNGKIESKVPISEVLKDSRATCDNMVVFGEYTYIFSKKTKEIYQLTNELKLVKTYDLAPYLNSGELENDGSFFYQAELKKGIFSIYEEDGSTHYFDVKADSVTPWDFSNPDYKNKYMLGTSSFIDLGNQQNIYYLDSKKTFDASGRGLSGNGDYYFLSRRNLTRNNPKEEARNTAYLVKVKGNKLKDFLEEYSNRTK
ncbi:hypothetical protein HCJ58_10090 [Listeria sp. FSL L7-1509]|uniref:Lipoprotein n=1 Tax=Listeria immobilis TaxID=2713502 RepID=A0ABR6SY65_9LIST|nr:hypothetical protein [Listeria immobilis]MBC1507308.1 hypothetical protein [Listeria immobilis]MBC1510626.1 hypothetical protein [Listeria immobilis]MBC6313168.1 hypothetical protein [Listeria immobilis]